VPASFFTYPVVAVQHDPPSSGARVPTDATGRPSDYDRRPAEADGASYARGYFMSYQLGRDSISRKRFLGRAITAIGSFGIGAAFAPEVSAALDARRKKRVKVDHVVRSDRPEVISWGFLPNRDAEPVLTMRSGETVKIEQISHEGILEDQGNPIDFFASWGIGRDEILDDQLMVYREVEHKGEGPHVITGPVAVEGAEPGDWLEVRCLDIEPRVAYGVNSARDGRGALPGEYPTGGKPIYSNLLKFDLERKAGLFPAGNGIEVPLRPFMGIVGVAPNTSAIVNSIPPSVYGGNLDVKSLMTASSTAYYPVQVPGALLYTGDGHAAQGDGEVSLTAIETSQTPTFSVVLHKEDRLKEEGLPLMSNPWGETKDAWIVTGIDTDLGEAMQEAVRETISFLTQTQGLTRDDAYSLASIGVDFEVSQVVDINKGIHARVYKHLFTTNRRGG
jgi:acetamidase/formamidase